MDRVTLRRALAALLIVACSVPAWAAKLHLASGATSQTIYIIVTNSSTGAPLTGLAYNSAGLICSYNRPRAASVAITLATQTVTGAYSSGGFVEQDATKSPGEYRLDVPDAALAAGVGQVVVTCTGATNMLVNHSEIALGFDATDGVRAGLTALPNVASGSAGAIPTTGTGSNQINVSGGRADSNVLYWNSSAVSVPTNAGVPNVNAKTWNDIATVALPLVPTTAGRTLDVSTGGEAGVDWANVGSPTTTLALTGTTIAITQKVDVETIKTNPVVNAGTVTFPTTATLASTTNITAGTITTTTNLTNAATAGDLTATMKASVNTEADTALADYDGPTYTELLNLVRLALRKDAALATDLAALITTVNTDLGSGAGAFANTTDSHEAIRDNMGTAQTGDTYALANGASGFVATKADTAAILVDTAAMDTADEMQTLVWDSTTVRALTELDEDNTTMDLNATTIGTVTTATTCSALTTNNDKTGYSLSAAGITALRALASGTCDSGTTTTIVDAARTEADTDYWRNAWVCATSGNIAGQCGMVTAFDAATDTMTVYPAFTQAWSTQTYEVFPAAPVNLARWLGVAPTALSSGRVDATVGAMQADVVTAASIQAAAITSSEAPNLDAAVTSRMATYTQPTGFLAATFPTTVASTTNITSATGLRLSATGVDDIWDEIQSGHTTAGTFGKYLDSQVSLAGGGSLTEAGIADAVWDELIAGHVISGSTAAKLSSAAAAGDPMAVAVPGSYASGTAGYKLGTLSGLVVATSPVNTTGDVVTVTAGDDYQAGEIAFTGTTWSIGASDALALLIGKSGAAASLTVTCARDSATACHCNMTRAQTLTLTAQSYSFALQQTTSTSLVHTLLRAGKLVVNPNPNP